MGHAGLAEATSQGARGEETLLYTCSLSVTASVLFSVAVSGEGDVVGGGGAWARVGGAGVVTACPGHS